ncbi:hypothetical protein [Teredinibacter franksiae]|uniref:hypothetical protein n=1 Tax=Teredinibacter franksiae TaxID=2761453 RepID=UPI00162AEBDC|nr:hypothetical protein [Teredinibacter franksiae]
MSDDYKKLEYDNDQLLMQLGWLLERVIVRDGYVELASEKLNEKDVLESLTELKRAVDKEVQTVE